jgi:hypothetical protein
MSTLFAAGRMAAGVLLIVLCAAPGRGAVPGDDVRAYSHVTPITVSGKQSVVQLRLPREVYLNSRSPDLNDLRLFDANGAALPFALIGQAQERHETKLALPTAIFPVFSEARGGRALPGSLEVRTSADGSVLSVTARQDAHAPRQPETVSSLILDLRPPQSRDNAMSGTPVIGLTLSLPPDLRNYSARIAIDASDDLQQWAELGEGTVSWLVNNSGASVRKDKIAFSPTGARYARISWLDGSPVQFAGITADHAQQTVAGLQMETLILQPAPGSVEHDLAYRSPIAIPVQALGLEMAAENVVLPVVIGTYVELPGKSLGQRTVRDFQPIASTTFFQLKQNGERRVSRDIALQPTHLGQWVLRFQGPLPEKPRLRVGWEASTLVFVAGGKGPYTLAYGRDKARPAQVDIGQVAPGFSGHELASLERAIPGTAVQQNEVAAIDNAASTPAGAAHDRMLLLWALLLAGVAVLAIMAWRLMTQMKREPPDSTPES